MKKDQQDDERLAKVEAKKFERALAVEEMGDRVLKEVSEFKSQISLVPELVEGVRHTNAEAAFTALRKLREAFEDEMKALDHSVWSGPSQPAGRPSCRPARPDLCLLESAGAGATLL